MIEVDKIKQAADDGFSYLRFVIALGQYIENQADILFAIKFHGGACDGWLDIFLVRKDYNKSARAFEK